MDSVVRRLIKADDINDKELKAEIDELMDEAKDVFAGHHPGAIGAVLAELVSLWLAGHQIDDKARKDLLRMHMDAVRAMLPLQLKYINDLIERSAGGRA